jgi:hypothetical protein
LIDGYERVVYVYGPLFGLILVTGLGGVVRIRRRPLRLIRLTDARRPGSMLPWVTAVVLLVFPIAVADFDYRYLLPVLPFACLAAGLAFAPARSANPYHDGAERGGAGPGREPWLVRDKNLGESGMAHDLVLSLPQARRLAVRLGQLLRPGGVRRILSTGESAGRSRRASAR